MISAYYLYIAALFFDELAFIIDELVKRCRKPFIYKQSVLV
ncbi:MAG: hypothetical protein JWQ57_2222 [Mucilaginibacter sp.]|nr:hypothetical protein [Mucilaginibacter sp.]